MVGTRIPLPGIDLGRVEALPVLYDSPGLRSPVANVSVLALGAAPLLTAFLIVEVAALLVPGWRALRHGGLDGRAKLAMATLITTLMIALFQAHGVAVVLQSIDLLGAGMAARLHVMLTLVTGTLLLWPLGLAVTRWGVTNGFALLIVGVPALLAVPDLVAASAARFVSAGLGEPLWWLAPAIALFAVVGATLSALGVPWYQWARRGRERPRVEEEEEEEDDEEHGPELQQDGRAAARPTTPYREAATSPSAERSIPLPACGVGPVDTAANLISVLTGLATLGLVSSDTVQDIVASPVTLLLASLPIVALLVWLLARLFNRPASVAAVWRARDPSLAEPDAARALRVATPRSGLYILFVFAAGEVSLQLVAIAVPVLSAALVTAMVVDGVREWRARAARELVTVWPEHRPYAASTIVETLRDAGIEPQLRNAGLRTMLQFFGPYVPIEVMVSPADAKRAKRILDRRLLGIRKPKKRRAADR